MESKSFQQLRDLVKIVAVAGPTDWPTLSIHAVESSVRPYARLFRATARDGANERKVNLEMSAARAESMDMDLLVARSPWLRKVKSRLKQRLLNTLFVLDLDRAGHSDYSKQLFAVNRKVFISRVLDVFGLRELAVKEAKSGLPIAVSLEEWSSAMEFLIILRIDAAMAGSRKAHAFLHAQYEYCQNLLAKQQEAEVCVERLQVAFAKTGTERPEFADAAEDAANKIEALTADHETFNIKWLEFRLRSLATQIRMDYSATARLCDMAFDLLDRYPRFKNRSRAAEYAIMGLVSAYHLRDGIAALRWIEYCNKTITSNENNWFVYKACEFLHLMQSRKFVNADELISAVRANPRYGTQTEPMANKWELFRMCAEYGVGKRVPIANPGDFAALVPAFTSDKAGLNTSMILLHVLLMADRERWLELRDRSEFLRGYRKRHLKGPENSQANRLFRMLELIASCDLSYTKVVRKARPLLEELKKSEAEEPIQGEQIFPYTWVWERLMERLQNYRPLIYRDEEEKGSVRE